MSLIDLFCGVLIVLFFVYITSYDTFFFSFLFLYDVLILTRYKKVSCKLAHIALRQLKFTRCI